MKNVWYYNYPIGKIAIVEEEGAISRIIFGDAEDFDDFVLYESLVIQAASVQLTEYFDGRRTGFSVPVSLRGTAFQQLVWRAVQQIRAGETRTYKEIAGQIGNAKAARAVGLANSRNPLPIIVPCHRVIGTDGSLTGYAGGLPRKQYLLELERRAGSEG